MAQVLILAIAFIAVACNGIPIQARGAEIGSGAAATSPAPDVTVDWWYTGRK
ncbi:hypothetical protein BDR26DRAFT_931806 [Obelidium mucronatum]|nr:hypothetical protein BDR26DRAFT_931806 [Obelidium mucronatum]